MFEQLFCMDISLVCSYISMESASVTHAHVVYEVMIAYYPKYYHKWNAT